MSRTSAIKHCLTFAQIFMVIACSSHTEGLRKAAADLEGSLISGMNYVDYAHRVQALGSAISLAKREGASQTSLRPYVEAFDMYTDGLDLWKLEIDCPADFNKPGKECDANLAPQLGASAAKYGIPYEGLKIHNAWKEKYLKSPYGQGPRYPKWEVRKANGKISEQLLLAIFDRANKKSKEQ